MKAIRKVTIEQIIEPEQHESIHLEEITIAGKSYTLDIGNHTQNLGKESLTFKFNEEEYEIRVDEDGISFRRLKYRHSHDHNDSQSLQIKTDDSKPEPKGGTILWRTRFPHNGEGYDFYKIPFGAIEEE